MSEIVCVRTFPNRMQAEFAKSILEEENIRALVSGDSGGWVPHLTNHAGGIQLFVTEENAERAGVLLQETMGE